MQTFSKIFTMVVNALTGIITLGALIIIIMFVIGIKPAVVLSGSMEPTVETGSVAFVDTRDKVVDVGDVVQYRIIQNNEEVKILHRIVGTNPDGTFITKGDNNESADLNSVSADQINGTYKMRIPGIGYIIETPLYIILFFSGIIFLHLLAWILTVIADDDDDTPKAKKFSLG